MPNRTSALRHNHNQQLGTRSADVGRFITTRNPGGVRTFTADRMKVCFGPFSSIRHPLGYGMMTCTGARPVSVSSWRIFFKPRPIGAGRGLKECSYLKGYPPGYAPIGTRWLKKPPSRHSCSSSPPGSLIKLLPALARWSSVTACDVPGQT